MTASEGHGEGERSEVRASSNPPHPLPEGGEAWRGRLVELAEGWECASRLTSEIVKAFQPEIDAFSASEMRDGKEYDIRLIRAVLDERSQRDRFDKDAAALRALIDSEARLAGEVERHKQTIELLEEDGGNREGELKAALQDIEEAEVRAQAAEEELRRLRKSVAPGSDAEQVSEGGV